MSLPSSSPSHTPSNVLPTTPYCGEYGSNKTASPPTTMGLEDTLTSSVSQQQPDQRTVPGETPSCDSSEDLSEMAARHHRRGNSASTTFGELNPGINLLRSQRTGPLDNPLLPLGGDVYHAATTSNVMASNLSSNKDSFWHRQQWMNRMADLVATTDPAWFTRYQMDLHHPHFEVDRDTCSIIDEESSRVYLIKSRFGNLRGAESKRNVRDIEDVANAKFDDESTTQYGVQSDDEVAGGQTAYIQDLVGSGSDDDFEPLILDAREVDLKAPEDGDRQWWMRHYLDKRAPVHKYREPLVPPHPREIVDTVVSHHITRRQGILAILKGFVGTGMLFLPHAVAQGGLLFSCGILLLVWICSLYSMVLLIDCAEVLPTPRNSNVHSFGSIGRHALGRVGSILVNLSVFLSQLGFCCVYSVFIAKNVGDMIATHTGCNVGTSIIIVFLLPILIPMSWIRKLKHLTPAIFIANIFVSTASVTIIVIAIGIVALSGVSRDILSVNNLLWNRTTWPLTLGFTLYVWEGIGLVIPIKNSLTPHESIGHRYAKTLSVTMLGILLLYLAFGGLLFCTYGTEVNQVILLSLPETPLTFVLQIMFTVSCLCSYPLQFFPAARIMERLFVTRMLGSILGPDPMSEGMVVTVRNLTRSMLVLLTTGVSFIMKDRIDLLTSFIGCLCCLPLSLIYPVLFHLLTRKDVKTIGEVDSFRNLLPKKSSIRRLPVRPINYAIIILGLTAMVFTGQQTTKAFLDYIHHRVPPIPSTPEPTHAPTIGPRPSITPLPSSTSQSSTTAAKSRTTQTPIKPR